MSLYKLLIIIINMSLAFVPAKRAIHMFQQNRYELYRYSKWLFNTNNLSLLIYLLFVILDIILGIIFKMPLLNLALEIILAIILINNENNKKYIKDLVLTARVKRQIIVFSLLYLVFILLASNIFKVYYLSFFDLYMPYLLIYLMAIITLPMEEAIKKHYENDARKTLADLPSLIKIGITGSYGKTSSKNIINDIISDDFFTLITPASFNTPMGITRTIREMLKPIHEVFVCEMGADKVGDISYLMDFVKPKYGIVSSIGPQHLNTFKSLDNIINEKMKMIEMLDEDGVGIVNIDNDYIRNYEFKNNHKVITVSTIYEDADYYAYDIKYDKNGSKFKLKINDEEYSFETILLGKHNITNILLGIALANELNINPNRIVNNVSNIKQIEHRLEIKKINGLTFIDDAFNSNPVGSKMALDVLSLMDSNRIIVTPGMIDLGSKEDEINKEFGFYMKDKADYVLLVGELQTKKIYEGLLESGFNLENIIIFKTVREAFEYIYSRFTSSDTILLENDLPDAFNV